MRPVLRVFRWLVLMACAALVVDGLFRWGLFHADLWTATGRVRLAWWGATASAAAAVCVWLRPAWVLPAALLAAVSYAVFAIGWPGPAGALLALAASYALGRLILRRDPRDWSERIRATACGLATFSFAIQLLARFPVNYPAVYIALMGAAILTLPFRRMRLALPPAPRRRDAAALALLLAVLSIHFLPALTPEAGADALAVHLVIPSRLAYHHLWPFDVRQFTWAVMPMGADWAFALAFLPGGEYAARLFNFSFLALATALLVLELPRRLSAWCRFLLGAAFASVPLFYFLSTSLVAENYCVLLVLAALVSVDRYRREGRAADALAAGILAGGALAAKFSSLLLATILVGALVVAFRRRREPWRLPAAALALVLVFGCVPYLEAWLRTGNPVFPYLNHIFRSPLFPSGEPLADPRFHQPLTWRTLYDLTFFTDRFMESRPGGFGFVVLLLLPLSLTLGGTGLSFAARLAPLLALGGGALLVAALPNLRYTAPLLAPLILWIGHALARLPGRQPRLFHAAAAALAAAVLLQAWFSPAATWQHRDFFIHDLAGRRERATFLEREAPGRVLIESLSGPAPRATVALLASTDVGQFPGTVVSASWHSEAFYRALQQVSSAAALAQLIERRAAQYIIAPEPWTASPAGCPYISPFLERFTEPVLAVHGRVLARFTPGRAPRAGAPPAAGPGWHDDVNPCAEYSGKWWRDVQFPQAFQGTLVYAADPGAEVSFRFRGPSAALLFTRAHNRGQAALFIDGRAAGVLDAYAPGVEWQCRRPFDNLGEGSHVLTLRILPTRSARSSGTWFDVDGFIVPAP